MARCENCGSKECCGAEMGPRIEELEEMYLELKRLRKQEALDNLALQRKYEALVDGVQRIYNSSVQYQEKSCPGDFDATVYLKVKREELCALLEENDG